MVHKKYTLPRHTILAKQGKRTGAFLIDLAIWVGLTLAFFFGCFNLAFTSLTKPNNDLIDHERLNSGLYLKNDKGEPEMISSENDYNVFIDALKYYYFNYLPGNDIKEGLEPCKIKDDTKNSVAWFNENILEIDVKGSQNYFTYVMVGEEPDKTQIGVKAENASLELVNIFIQRKYESTVLDDLNQLSFMREAGEKVMFYSTVAFSFAAFVGGAITYVLVPWFIKNGQTVGKKVYGLGLADIYGYKYKNVQLLMRFMPVAVVDLSLILLVLVNLYLVLSIVLIIFLVSFAIAMASPKKTALHDLTARTIVVDLKESVLFDNEIDEEAYIANEDGLTPITQNENEEGEEPELSYEK